MNNYEKHAMLEFRAAGWSDERLEMLSDKVRMGVPIDFSEAIEVIDYQMKLQQERKTNSWIYKVRRFFGFEQ